jgi:hypothetical protein
MKARGQTLVLFALFLTVLIGVSALAIDYANWLLTDRKLQNVSDHAALAGASVFNQNVNQASCSTNPGQQLCVDARIHAWTSLSQELDLGLDPVAVVDCLANVGNTPEAGWTNASEAGCPDATFDGHHLWVSTPPPSNRSYQRPGPVNGRLAGNFGIVWVRVDRPTQTFLSGIFGINARDRIGWATAGVLPNDFALQLFCRNGTNPAGGNSVCTSKGLGIEGGGGIELIRGDIGSNQSLQVTQQGGSGVVLRNGNVFLVEGTCGPSTWNCSPQTTGGISDGNGNAKNAFYIPPQPVPHFESPLDYATLTTCPTQAEWDDVSTGHVPCVPWRPDVSSGSGDWWCLLSDSTHRCGEPERDVNGAETGRCDAWSDPNGAPEGERHLRPNDDVGSSQFKGSEYSPNDIYKNIGEDPSMDPAGSLNVDLSPTTLSGPVDNWIYSNDGISTNYRTAIQPPNGVPDPGNMTVRYVLFKTINNGAIDPAAGGNTVTVTVQLQENVGGTWTDRGPADTHTATELITGYQYNVSATAITNFSALSLRVTVATTRSTGGSAGLNRGAGISWAELETTNLQPALPPMIPPGRYHSIDVGEGGCAILDPTGSQEGLELFQLAGVYRFSGTDATLHLNRNSLLVGDGVTLVFDRDFPDPSGGRGINLESSAVLVLNVSTAAGFNFSDPLSPLTADSLAAAWAIDPTTTAGVYQGQSMWGPSGTHTYRGVCTDSNLSATSCIDRASYAPLIANPEYRGITFYFTNNWPATTIRDRFQMSGSTGSEPGLAYRGILYAPYDDVKLTGGNGFNTIGQVLAWTAKFAGQSTIYLDYPYTRCEQTNSCLPYLLEPTVNQ